MSIWENIRSALGAIASNKLRSALTMLGVIIGVASVVLMIAIGQGAQRGVTSRIQTLGTNLLSINAGSTNQTNVRSGGGAGAVLTSSDLEAIRTLVPGLQGIAPELRSRVQAIAGSNNMSTNASGTTEDYPLVRNAQVEYGSFFTADQVRDVEKVAVIGSAVATALFPNERNPLGMDIRLQNQIFTVIGILAPKGQQGFTNLDDVILIPLTAMQQRIVGSDSVGSISVSVQSAENMSETQNIIAAVLRNEHGITDPADDDFSVLNQADAVQTLNEVTGIFTLLLGGIAAISLIVGGIGVMNIMLVSVTERTREIGIRKAIGAKKRDILLQFLVEATVLSVMGGIIGTLLSAVGAWIMQTFFSFDASISLSSVALACVFSAGIGVCFGMLPAYKAATLRPIQALRYE